MHWSAFRVLIVYICLHAPVTMRVGVAWSLSMLVGLYICEFGMYAAHPTWLASSLYRPPGIHSFSLSASQLGCIRQFLSECMHFWWVAWSLPCMPVWVCVCEYVCLYSVAWWSVCMCCMYVRLVWRCLWLSLSLHPHMSRYLYMFLVRCMVAYVCIWVTVYVYSGVFRMCVHVSRQAGI